MAKARTNIQCYIILKLIKTIYMQGSEQEESYGKHFSWKDSVPDVLRLMGTIRGDQSLQQPLLSQTVTQHLQLIKLSRTLVIKTKERSNTELQNIPALIFSYRHQNLMKILLIMHGLLKIRYLNLREILGDDTSEFRTSFKL